MRLSCTLFALWTLLIYLTIPIARPLREYIAKQFGRSFFGYAVFAAIAAGFFSAVFYLKRKPFIKTSAKNFVWLTVIAGFYVYFTFKLWKIPEEAIHFLEYGILSYFAYRALTHHVRDVTLFFTASFVVLFVGTVDEIIQWMVPGRYWDFRDIWLNLLSGALFQLAIAKGFNPSIISDKIKPKSVMIFSIVFVSCLILLGLCASNTPLRIARYTEKIPVLSYLRSNHAMMREYGYRHSDPDIGVFYSRFSKENLKSIDLEKKAEYSNVLNTSQAMGYKQFMEIYNPYTLPFLYEMRIHMHRRDQYMTQGQKVKNDENRLKAYLTIAFKENFILEKYFGNTLKRSVYQWPQKKVRGLENRIDSDTIYESPVCSDLFTLFTERQLWFAILGVLFILTALNFKMLKAKS